MNGELGGKVRQGAAGEPGLGTGRGRLDSVVCKAGDDGDNDGSNQEHFLRARNQAKCFLPHDHCAPKNHLI